MRNLVIILVALIVAGCSGSPVTRTQSPSVTSTPKNTPELEKASVDSAQEFLLTAAASDFHAHGPSPILRFRDLHMRSLVSQTGAKTYILCGQFLAEQQGGKAEWTPFVTIKTSGYEQYLGATRFCEEGSVIEGKEGDLSSLLQTRFDSLK